MMTRRIALLIALCFMSVDTNVGVSQAPAEKPPAVQKFEALVDSALAKLEEIPDYSYTLRKQERVDDVLLDPQQLVCKIRHEPFSIYLRFTAPKNIQGKEALYVEGQNDGKLIGRGVGVQKLFGTQKLDPRSAIAMMGNRNPITDSGMKNILLKLKTMLARPEAVKAYEFVSLESEDNMVDKRPCLVVEVRNPKPTREQLYARTRISFDREWGVPVRLQRWYWSQPVGGKELLVEDYTYENVKLNCGFTDKDFDPENPEYGF